MKLPTESWTESWQFFAICSAIFAAMTAIFGKVGVSKINSDLATFIRTIVILGVIALLVSLRNGPASTARSVTVRIDQGMCSLPGESARICRLPKQKTLSRKSGELPRCLFILNQRVG